MKQNMMGDDWWEYCVTKSKLTITVSTFSKYNDRSSVAVKQINKQTQRHRSILTNRHTSRLALEISTQSGKQKIDNDALCSAIVEINKYVLCALCG